MHVRTKKRLLSQNGYGHISKIVITNVSSGCVRRSAFQVLASTLKPIREVSSVASVAVLQLTGVAMMKLHAGLDDGCVDALPILFAANMQI